MDNIQAFHYADTHLGGTYSLVEYGVKSPCFVRVLGKLYLLPRLFTESKEEPGHTLIGFFHICVMLLLKLLGFLHVFAHIPHLKHTRHPLVFTAYAVGHGPYQLVMIAYLHQRIFDMLAPLRGWEQSVSIPDHYPVVIIAYPFYGFIVGLTNVLAAVVWCQLVYDWLLPVNMRHGSEIRPESLRREGAYLKP